MQRKLVVWNLNTASVSDNLEFLKLTLEILAENSVTSVAFSFSDQAEIGAICEMLDKSFGVERPFLKRADTLVAMSAMQNGNFEKISLLLHRLASDFSCHVQNVVLVDSDEIATKSGFRVIHANQSRKKIFCSPVSPAYLFELLCETVSLPAIHATLARMPKSAVVEAYKRCLLHYQLHNLRSTFTAHAKLDNLDDRTPKKYKEVEAGYEKLKNINAVAQKKYDEEIAQTKYQEEVAQTLLALEYVLLNTPWELKYFGGCKKTHPDHARVNTFPRNISDILNAIASWRRSGNLERVEVTADSIKRIAADATIAMRRSFFDKTGENTKQLYKTLAKIQLRHPRPLPPPSLAVSSASVGSGASSSTDNKLPPHWLYSRPQGWQNVESRIVPRPAPKRNVVPGSGSW